MCDPKFSILFAPRKFGIPAVLCLLATLTTLDTSILRHPCSKLAVFDVIHIGKRLASDVILVEQNVSDFRCTEKCVQQPKCRSYNINTKDQTCELNGKAEVDSGTRLVDDAEWIYKSTDFSALLVCTLSIGTVI